MNARPIALASYGRWTVWANGDAMSRLTRFVVADGPPAARDFKRRGAKRSLLDACHLATVAMDDDR